MSGYSNFNLKNPPMDLEIGIMRHEFKNSFD